MFIKEIVENYNGVDVKIPTIEGLKDTNVQDKINKALEQEKACPSDDCSALLQEIARGGLCIYFFGYFAACLNIVLAGYFSAMERADLGFLISLMRGLAVIAPAAFILAKVFGMTGVWIAVPVAEVLTLVISVIMVRFSLKKRELVT